MNRTSAGIIVKDPDEVEGSDVERINIDPKNVEKGLAKLVLTLIELIRKLLEKQAIRRMDGGSLSGEKIESIGEAFMQIDNKMKELKDIFGVKDEELNINLGPLGDLM